MKCPLCERNAAGKFCSNHETAYVNLMEKFKEWQRAVEVNQEEYLRRVGECPTTGVWVKEVAAYILQEKQTQREV